MTLAVARTKRSADSLQLDARTATKSQKCAPPPVKAQPLSPLFRLPHEIRQQVFLLALARPCSSALLDTTHDDLSDTEPALLFTCRRVRHEALPLFYSSNDWVVKTRRVGGDTGRLDPVSKRLVTYEYIPRWIDALHQDKMALIRSVVFVGSRGSYVDINGKWRDGDRAAFRLKRSNGRLPYRIEEVLVHDAYNLSMSKQEKKQDVFCSIELVDLLKARMRINAKDSCGKWLWTKEHIHDLAFLL